MLTRIRRSLADRDQGFTLIELLVVIIIIGILAAIAIPVFLNQRKKSVDASIKSDLRSAAVMVETWTVDNPGIAILQESASAPAATGGVMNGLKISPGNTMTLYPSGATVGGWCLYSRNPNSSKVNDGAHWMVWRSLVGGLDPTISAVGGTDCL